MSAKKSMVAINPQISLTIGNPEIVNMLVQQQVGALRAERTALEGANSATYGVLQAGVAEVVTSLAADFEEAYGKKLDAYAKARSALVGRKLNWVSPYSAEPDNREIYRHGSVVIRSYSGDRSCPWTEKENAELTKSFDVLARMAEVPTSKDLDEWCHDWRAEYGTKQEAEEAWSEDNTESDGLYLKFKRSAKTVDLIKKYRLVDDERAPAMKRMKEIDSLLADTENIEKAVLAKMTQNTLESNPELIEAFSVLTKGVLGLPYIETQQLTVDAE